MRGNKMARKQNGGKQNGGKTKWREKNGGNIKWRENKGGGGEENGEKLDPCWQAFAAML